MAARSFEFVEGTSRKFWEVWLDGTTVYTRYGRLGAKGQTTLKAFGDEAAAQAHLEGLITQKTRKGYLEVAAAPLTGKEALLAFGRARWGAEPELITQGLMLFTALAAWKLPGTPTRWQLLSLGGSTLDLAMYPYELSGRGFEVLCQVEGDEVPTWAISTIDELCWHLSPEAVTTTPRPLFVERRGTEALRLVRSSLPPLETANGRVHFIELVLPAGYAGPSTRSPQPPKPKPKPAPRPHAPPLPGDNRAPPDIEAAILANPDDASVWAVYQDWLEAQGDPRAELMALQRRESVGIDEVQALVARHHDHLFGALAPYAEHPGCIEADWHEGFLSRLRLSAAPGVEVATIVQQLARTPSARFVRELTIGSPSTEETHLDYQRCVDALVTATPSLPLLTSLFIGDFTNNEAELSWAHLGELEALWPTVPRLKKLKLRGGTMTLGAPRLLSCESLTIETGGLEAMNLRAIATASWPALRRLELWFGQLEYGATCTIDDVLQLISSSNLPKLEHLGLVNSQLGDDIAATLAGWQRLSTLRSLDLSMSHLTTAGLKHLAAVKSKLARLERLNVSECLLDAAGQRLAASLAPEVSAKDQRDPAEYLEERYAAVGE